MARPSITPTNYERPFDLGELFFSTTDPKGIILSGNRVFARVSAYEEDELLGLPHNMIRHPDMPRVVFKMFWEYLEAGRPIAAYVKNMAKDGGYYWVLATATPVGNRYLSVRMKPSADLLPTVEALYASLVKTERAIESRGGTPRDAMEASGAQLAKSLVQLGFQDYDAFMHHALPTEIASRREQLSVRQATTRTPATPGPARTLPGANSDVAEAAAGLNAFLDRQFAGLASYVRLSEAFAEKSDFILDLADEVRLFALNAQVGAARLQEVGAALGVIAGTMHDRSDETTASIRAMSEDIRASSAILSDLSFEISMATIQSEVAVQFIEELREEAHSDSVAVNIATLSGCLRQGVGPLLASLADLDVRLDSVARHSDTLSSVLQQLEVLQMSGRIETARLSDDSVFRGLFEEISTQVARARAELASFDIVQVVRRERRQMPPPDALARYLDQIDAWQASSAVPSLAAA